MAISVIKLTTELGPQLILTPERYNPKRRMDFLDDNKGVILSEIIELINDIITTKKLGKEGCYQINTADAMGGYLNIPKNIERINSNKKQVKKGDVIISRLRPYLRQVAYVDKEPDLAPIAASTEFYVLRSKNNESIAFLVPFLLSDVVQTVFANSVEGSQHPRFKEEDILNLIIPDEVYEQRTEISAQIVEAIESYRLYENIVSDNILVVNTAMLHVKKDIQSE